MNPTQDTCWATQESATQSCHLSNAPVCLQEEESPPPAVAGHGDNGVCHSCLGHREGAYNPCGMLAVAAEAHASAEEAGQGPEAVPMTWTLWEGQTVSREPCNGNGCLGSSY